MAALVLALALLGTPSAAAPRAEGGPVLLDLAPGVRFTSWTEAGDHGPVRLYLLSVDYRRPGVRWDYRNTGEVASTDTVLDMAKTVGDRAIAAVNGDFYDIGRTGAPLGVGRSRAGGLYNGRLSAWNSAFYVTPKGRPEIGTVTLQARIRRHPDLTVTNLNSRLIAPDGIGVYTPRWGPEPDDEVTGGDTSAIRRVRVVDGVVTANGRRLRAGRTIDGTVLIGRGASASALRDELPIGTRVRVSTGIAPQASMVLTGDRFLIEDGVVRVVDNTRLAPRTAIGIDRETHQLLVLVADGRRERSRGMTMVELANEMADLGADEALNLDGGGSSTMVVRPAGGQLAVRNKPSDGFQRQVANSLVFTYQRPKG